MISIFRFPNDPERLNLWLEFANRGNNWNPSKSSVLCSKHFEEKYFDHTSWRVCLKSNAIPTILPSYFRQVVIFLLYYYQFHLEN